MSLTPKQLLAETAKFFSINPSKWIRGRLQRGDCFCTVGYMAHRLHQEGVPGAASDPYSVVGRFFKGRFGSRADALYHMNDNAGDPEVVVDKLKEFIVAD